MPASSGPPQVVVHHRDAVGVLLAAPRVQALEWSRRFAASGAFRLDLSLEQGRSIECGHTIDVELDGRVDFTGVVQNRRLEYAPGRAPRLRLEGQDLTWWLHQRVVVPPDGISHDEQLGVPAEMAIRHYLSDHLLQPADAARTIPIPAALDAAHAPPLGPLVSARGRFLNLARLVERLADQAGLGLSARRDPDGVVRFGVVAPRNRTRGSASPVIFSPHHGTIQELRFDEQGVRSPNAVYALGAGSAEQRLVELRSDAADVASHARREAALDARDAADADAAQDAAAAALARQAAERVRVEVLPTLAGPLRYRRDWDLGDVVTVDLPDVGLQLDRRIDAVRCRADDDAPLTIRCDLGAPPPDAATTLRRLDERTEPGRFV